MYSLNITVISFFQCIKIEFKSKGFNMTSRWAGVEDKFIDTDGNIKAMYWELRSENPTLFNVEYAFLLEMAGQLDFDTLAHLKQLIKNKWSTQPDLRYRTNDHDNNDSFSLDESVAVAAACYRYGFKENLGKLEIITKQTWFRFYDVIPFLMLCKYPKVKYLLFPQMLVAVFAFISCITNSPGQASGRNLRFVQWFGREMPITEKLCKWANEYVGTSHTMGFLNYFLWSRQSMHPINIVVNSFPTF